MASEYSGLDQKHAISHIHNKILNTPVLKLNPKFHIILSEAFTNFDISILSKEQELLVERYCLQGDTAPLTDDDLIQLDIALGAILKDECDYEFYS